MGHFAPLGVPHSANETASDETAGIAPMVGVAGGEDQRTLLEAQEDWQPLGQSPIVEVWLARGNSLIPRLAEVDSVAEHSATSNQAYEFGSKRKKDKTIQNISWLASLSKDQKPPP